MIIKNFVYLDTKANRLMIVQEPIDSEYFVELMSNNGTATLGNQQTLLSLCKIFCIGFIMGAYNENKKPINDLNEFK